MRIILVDKYFFIKGGAEESFFQTADLLKSKGHKVVFFSMHHSRNLKTEYEKYFVSEVDHEKQRGIKALSNAIKIIYSTEAYKKISSLIKEEKPDIAHLHNIYHQLSPSIIDALKKFRVPMVMTLHDYKLVCPSYSLFCNGRVCQKCQNKKFYHCFLSRCVKDSYLKSLVNTIEMYVHHCLWHIYDKVDVFISPSMFLKEKLKEMGFNKRIEYLPNFVRLDDFTPEYEFSENSVVYFGRLSKEKGLATLLRAMQGLPNIKLKLVGEGPMRAALEKEAENLNLKNVEFLGYKNKQELQQEIKKSMCVVLPSE
ncbi:MAG: glycosyltransferase, partial [Candidatus Diapherotrites archaeon]|nr:glycosyltransferase [Candidatus Diapherotrites archaeon]